MRYRLLLIVPSLLSLLTACSKQNAGPRLDLVGSGRYVSFNRDDTRPGDTLTFKLYADTRDAEVPLRRVRILVTYTPLKNPVSYPQGFVPGSVPADREFTYLDSAITTKDFVLQTTFNARTTSGREQWRFEAEDAGGNTVRRGFRLQVRNNDSANAYHGYTAQLQAPNGNGNRRSFLALLPGLTLPRYTVRANADARNIVDVVYVANQSGIYLAAPNDALVTHVPKWTTRPTEFRTTTLDKTGFDGADTSGELIAAFGTPATPPLTHTDPIAKGKVYAFRTKDQKSGLLYVQDILLTTPVPTVLLQVRITK
ncbi:hypothetical protein GCM10022408_33160 [Hymenobacter fastidiosus]|uniref:DUF5007 domain-containing protein n=1 Tax=Hymenobacter fastidiosus TaxID=486264 RepID=A0ABP7SV73_9BACT